MNATNPSCMVGMLKKPAAVTTAAATITVRRRVVTCFILTHPSNRVALFHQCDNTLSSFPSYWAGISGTIKSTTRRTDDVSKKKSHDEYIETPYQAVRRKLSDETNLLSIEVENVYVEEQGGLYLDVVPYYSAPSSRTTGSQQQLQLQRSTIIHRVYPFAVHISDEEVLRFELRGSTEHQYDAYKFVRVEELAEMDESHCVPGLRQAFHHATYGKFNCGISDSVRRWSYDKENGASMMTQKALQLVNNSDDGNSSDDSNDKESRTTTARSTMARHIAMLRPSMVSIVNVMHRISTAENGKASVVSMASFLLELDRCVEGAQHAIEQLITEKSKANNAGGNSSSQDDEDKMPVLTIATFSRSGTIAKTLKPFVKKNSCTIICSQSTPGDEGELMATDLKTTWIADTEIHKLMNRKIADDNTDIGNKERINNGTSSSTVVDVLLIGSDCILPSSMVNKVGTRRLCELAQENNIPVFCCADRWKVWDDVFPPPIETELFEFVPLNLVTKLLIPSPSHTNLETT